jgi:hypothetical protein
MKLLVMQLSPSSRHSIPRSRKPILTVVGIRCPDHSTPSIRKNVGTNFTDMWQTHGRCSSLAGKTPQSLFVCLFCFVVAFVYTTWKVSLSFLLTGKGNMVEVSNSAIINPYSDLVRGLHTPRASCSNQRSSLTDTDG